MKQSRSLRPLIVSATIVLFSIRFAASGEESLRDLRGIWQAHFNYDASRVVLQLRGGAISLWDAETGNAILKDLARGREASGYVLRPDQKAALVVFQPRGARLFDLRSGEPISPELDVSIAPTIEPPQAAFSPDTHTLVLFDKDGAVHVFDLESGKHRIDPIPSGSMPSGDDERKRVAKFSAEGAWCFLMDFDGSVIRYDTKTWRPAGKPMRHPNQDGYTYGFDVSADGKWLATFDGGGESGSKDSLQMWLVETAKPIGKPIKATDGVTPTFLAEPGRVLLKYGRLGSGVFDCASGDRVFAIEPHDDVYGSGVSTSPDGRWLLSWGSDRFLTLQETASGKRAGTLPASCAATAALWSPDSRHCFVVFDNSAFIFEKHYDQYVMRVSVPEMKIDGSIRVLDFVHRAALSPDGRMLLILAGRSDHERARLFDARTMKEIE